MRQCSVGIWHPGESSECENFEWSLHNINTTLIVGGWEINVRQQLTLLLELSGFFIAIWIYLDGKSFCQRYFVTDCLKNDKSNLREFPITGLFNTPLKLQQPHVEDPWHLQSISNHMFKIPDIRWASEQGLTILSQHESSDFDRKKLLGNPGTCKHAKQTWFSELGPYWKKEGFIPWDKFPIILRGLRSPFRLPWITPVKTLSVRRKCQMWGLVRYSVTATNIATIAYFRWSYEMSFKALTLIPRNQRYSVTTTII